MQNHDFRVLGADEVRELLSGREMEILEVVRKAYEAHAAGHSSLPHSTFLFIPNQPRDRIIALPAYLGDSFAMAGVKWIGSFPENCERGEDRASAVVVLNSSETGRPLAILEGSQISAQRTAASAALAAQYLHGDKDRTRVGLIGCGMINFEILRFLRAVFPELRKVVVFDIDRGNAERFQAKCASVYGDLKVSVADNIGFVFERAPLLSFATTAVAPHVNDLAGCMPGSAILHISLRDLAPEIILRSDNVVDDINHVCRADTSLHLAEQKTKDRGFIRCTLADITLGRVPTRTSAEKHTIFSPFGLGVLDLAVSKFILELAQVHNRGVVLESFLPRPWTKR